MFVSLICSMPPFLVPLAIEIFGSVFHLFEMVISQFINSEITRGYIPLHPRDIPHSPRYLP